MNLIVAGTRTFNNYDLLKSKLDCYLSHLDNVNIISGMAPGADTLALKYAIASDNVDEVIEMPADWTKYGKAAGPIRNEAMAKIADACIVFWDGKSRGTANMIKLAKQYHLELTVVRYDS